jgi:general secretion pathway protein G
MALLIGSGELAKRRVPEANASRGFTLIELLVVMTIIATLLTLAVPRYFGSLEKAKEAVLREDLAMFRDALDKFFSDTGAYPAVLEDLVLRKYLRSIPVDPITESAATWVIVPPNDQRKGGIYSVKSGAEGLARDGTSYRDW